MILGVVVADFCAIGEELSGCKDMLDAEFLTEALQRRAEALQRHARLSNSGESQAEWRGDARELGEPVGQARRRCSPRGIGTR